MSVPDEHLEVRLHGALAGRLWRAGRDLAFAYASDWLTAARPMAISQSLALQADPHVGLEVEAFFGNLLPEGDVRIAVARLLQISERNDYALLDAIGGDCAGALSLAAPGAPASEAASGGELLSNEAVRKLVDDLPRRPLLAGERGVRLSLAGAQLKLALCKAGDAWMLPAPGAASTHILKPAIRDLAGSIENEAFCMTLAERCGLGVPACWIEPEPHLYVVERYDRVRDPATGRVRRLHQEDFCQALGVPSSRKYEAEGGPSLKDCFNLVRRVSSDPTGDLLRLLDWVIFNFLIGNHDAHAKNLSLLYRNGQTRLAPFYDLLSTSAYPKLSEKFAMRIGGAESTRYMAMRHWWAFAEDCGVNRRFFENRFLTTTQQLLKESDAVRLAFVSVFDALTSTRRVIHERIDTVIRMHRAEKARAVQSPG